MEKTKKEEKKKLLDLQEILKPLLFKKNKLFKSYQELDRTFAQKQSLIEFQTKELKIVKQIEISDALDKSVIRAKQEETAQAQLLKELKEKQKELEHKREQEQNLLSSCA